ncbi:MAG: twin transmembrane helix small protein [Burkholderiales bacterium]
MKIVVILFLIAIVGSLGSALFYMIRDKGGSTRTVRSLTIRVGLSVALFLMLMASYYFGLIPEQGL